MTGQHTYLLRRHRVAFLLGVVALTTLVTAALPSLAFQQTPARAAHIRIAAVEPNIKNYDPHKGFSGLEHRVLYAVFDQLVRFDRSGNFVPGLAESWEWPDARTLILTLRRGVKFHDGTPFNAEAVVFNFRRIMNPEEQSIVRGEWTGVESIEIVGEHRVKITLREPSAAFLASLTDRSGMMVSPTAVRQFGEEFGHRPVGAGPFVLQAWVPGSHATLVRNPDFWEKDFPKADRITVYQFKADEPAVRGLKSGGADFMQGVPAKDVEWVKASRNFDFIDRPTVSALIMSFNLTRPPADDPHFRRAIQAAIDRRAILTVVYGGIGQTGTSLLPKGFWSVDPVMLAPAYDPARARHHLSLSKYRGEKIGIVVSPDDRIVKTAQLVQQFLGDVGIQVEITPLPGPEQMARFFSGREFHGRIGGWSGRPDPHINYFAVIGCGGSFNVPRPRGYCDPKVDELLAQGSATRDRVQRQKAYYALDLHLNDQAMVIPLIHESWAVASRKNLGGFTPYLFGKPIYKEFGVK